MTKTTQTSFIKDLIKAQTEIQTLYKDESNPFFKSKYVPLASILREVKPVLNENGFLLTQQPCVEEGCEVLKTRIIHVSGESMECTAPLKMEERDKNNPQKFGSAITYMRRYTLTSLLALEEDDDDGQKASQVKVQPVAKKITQEQINQIQELINQTDKSAKDICGAYRINSLSDLLDSQFKAVVTRLKEMVKTNGGD